MTHRRYQMDDCTILLPEGYRDRTMQVVEWKTDEQDNVILMIQRDKAPAAPPGTPPELVLERYLAEQTREYPKRFAGFKLERNDGVSADARGLYLCHKAFRSTKEHDVLYHHQAFVLASSGILVFTGASHARHRAQVDVIVESALLDLRFRED